MPPVNLGILTHHGSDVPRFDQFVMSAFPTTTVAANVFPGRRPPLSAEERANVMNAAEDWIRARPLDVVFLEANLGQPEGPLTFDPEFFARFPAINFVVFYGTCSDIATLRNNRPNNVLSIAQKPNIFTPLREAISQTAEELATIPSEREGTGVSVLDRAVGADGLMGDLPAGGNLRPAQAGTGGLQGTPDAGGTGNDDSDGPEPEG